MVSSGMLHRVALATTEVSEELSASFIKVTKIGELGTTLAVTSNRRTLQRNTRVQFGAPELRLVTLPLVAHTSIVLVMSVVLVTVYIS
jgi:hypothetical protein